MKNVLVKLLALVILTTCLGLNAWAGGVTKVNEVRLHGLDEFRGLMLSAFYVSGRPAALGTLGSRPQLREVLKIAGPFEIHGQNTPVIVPKTDIIADGFRTYNFIVFVVHSPYLEVVAIRNLDGKIPTGLEHLDLSGKDEMSPFNHKYDFSINKQTLTSEADKSTGVVNLVIKPKLVNYQAN
jgi:hypothetical protein